MAADRRARRSRRSASAGEDEPDARGHLRDRDPRHDHPAAAPARRHGQGPGRGPLARARSGASPRVEPYFAVELNELRDAGARHAEAQALVRSVQATFENYVKLNKKVPPETLNHVAAISDAGSRSPTRVVAHLNLKLDDRQELLEIARPGAAPRGSLQPHAGRDRGPRGRAQDPRPREEADGALAEGVLPQRADARDPEGARRARRVQERARGARGAARGKKMPHEAQEPRREGDQQAQADVADERRSDGRAQLHRLDPDAPLERVQGGEQGHPRGRAHPRRRPLRAREAEGAHPRVSRGRRRWSRR